MDHSTSSIGESRIALRDDIRFRPQTFGGETCYILEDPTSSSFYRIGVAEYTLISLFDGRNTIADAMQYASTVLGRDAFTEQEVAAISRWLVDSGLAKTHTSAEPSRLHRKGEEHRERERWQWLNPIITKIPLFQPETILSRVSPLMMWLTTWPAFLVWVLAVFAAIHQLATHANRLELRLGQLLTPDNWFWLGLIWLGLKIVHELFHGLFCRKYGGEVREAGMVLIAFAPIFYVDVTASWRFPSKWQRILVAAAGMYVEIFIGAVAALVWIHSAPGLVNQLALNVLILSTITTILFNANPLMRFDGYYILSDLIEIPNLAPQRTALPELLGTQISVWGQAAVSALLRFARHLYSHLWCSGDDLANHDHDQHRHRRRHHVSWNWLGHRQRLLRHVDTLSRILQSSLLRVWTRRRIAESPVHYRACHDLGCLHIARLQLRHMALGRESSGRC